MPHRRLGNRALVAGLCVAAATAVLALLTGDLGDTDWRIISTSLAFSVFGALGNAGLACAERRRDSAGQAIGRATAAAALVGFALLVPLVWFDVDSEALVRTFGVVALGALLGSHVSTVLRASRDDDTPAIRTIVAVSLVLAAVVMGVGDAIVLGADDVSDGVARILSAALVVLVVTTILPPLLRHGARDEPVRAPVAPAGAGDRGLAAELEAVAARLDALGAVQASSEAATLRALAARAAQGAP